MSTTIYGYWREPTKKKIDPRWNEIHRRHPPRYSIARQFHMFSPLASGMPPKIRNRLNQSYRGLRVHKPKEVQNSEEKKKPASSWACRSLISGKTPRCGMRDVANYWVLTCTVSNQSVNPFPRAITNQRRQLLQTHLGHNCPRQALQTCIGCVKTNST